MPQQIKLNKLNDWISKLTLNTISYCFTLLVCDGPCNMSSFKQFSGSIYPPRTACLFRFRKTNVSVCIIMPLICKYYNSEFEFLPPKLHSPPLDKTLYIFCTFIVSFKGKCVTYNLKGALNVLGWLFSTVVFVVMPVEVQEHLGKNKEYLTKGSSWCDLCSWRHSLTVWAALLSANTEPIG